METCKIQIQRYSRRHRWLRRFVALRSAAWCAICCFALFCLCWFSNDTCGRNTVLICTWRDRRRGWRVTYNMPYESFHAPTAAGIPHSIAVDAQIDALVNHFLCIHFGEITFQFSAVTVMGTRQPLSNWCSKFLNQLLTFWYWRHADRLYHASIKPLGLRAIFSNWIYGTRSRVRYRHTVE